MMHDDQSLLTAAAALHALDEQEAQALEAHVETCATCTTELAGFRETAARLGTAVSAAPPPAMRQAVLDRLALTRQLPPQVSSDHRHSARPATAPTTAGESAGPAGPVVSLDDARRRRNLRTWLIAAAAAVLVVIGVGTAIVVNRNSEVADPLRECLSSSTDERPLTPLTSVGTPQVDLSARCSAASVRLTGLPPLQPNQTYQFWLAKGQLPDITPRSIGIYQAVDGAVPEVVTAVQSDDTAFAVSVEPAGGSATPTDIVIVVPFA